MTPPAESPVLRDSRAAPAPSDRRFGTRAAHRPVLRASLLAVLLAGCAVPAEPDERADPPCDPGPPPIAGPPALDVPCSGAVAEPTRLVVTTTDFSTGAVGVVDLRTGEVTADLALGSSDAKPFVGDGEVLILHRYMVDALDVLDPDERLALLGQVGITAADALSSNPHAVALGDDHRAYLTLFGAPELQVLDLADPSAIRVVDRVDLCPLADADGNPEASLILRCGGTVFLTIQRLDRDALFAPTGAHDHLAAVDLATGRLHDFDPDAPGTQPLPLLGPWAKQWRLDPRDPAGHTLVVLSTGLERLDLATLTAAWAVAPARLASVGVTDRAQPQAFDLADDGRRAYLAAYTADFAEVVLYRADLDVDAPLVEVARGLQSVEQTLEVVGDTLWFGDRTHGAAGMRAWDLSVDPPAPRFAGARSTGLAPYALVAIP
jgi:hypothetical protein